MNYLAKVKQYVTAVKQYIIDLYKKITQKITEREKDVDKPPIKKVVIAGSAVLGIFLLLFSSWSYFAPLEQAAIAQGKVTVDTNRKTIQHLEGGIVKAIHVRDGSKVKKGETLISLDETQPRARLDILQAQMYVYLAIEARLVAERDDAKKITWPKRLLEVKDRPSVKKIMHVQNAIFNAKKKYFDGQLRIFKKRIDQVNKQIHASTSQVKSFEKQLKLIEEELVAVKYLEKRKLIEKPRLLALQREAARLLGNKGEQESLVAKSEQQIGETQQKIISLKDDFLKRTLDELIETQSKLADVTEKEVLAKDVLKRTKIISPKSGRVVNLQIHTIGAVISPGVAIMDIVPDQDKLIIEAQISPNDIDVVHKGLTAKVQLTVYKQRNAPTFKGKVIMVSADSIVDEKNNITFYMAKIEIPEEQLKKYPKITLYPGMPASVMIITDKRSAFRYFVQPLQDSFDKAFREE